MDEVVANAKLKKVLYIFHSSQNFPSLWYMYTKLFVNTIVNRDKFAANFESVIYIHTHVGQPSHANAPRHAQSVMGTECSRLLRYIQISINTGIFSISIFDFFDILKY